MPMVNSAWEAVIHRREPWSRLPTPVMSSVCVPVRTVYWPTDALMMGPTARARVSRRSPPSVRPRWWAPVRDVRVHVRGQEHARRHLHLRVPLHVTLQDFQAHAQANPRVEARVRPDVVADLRPHAPLGGVATEALGHDSSFVFVSTGSQLPHTPR